MTKFCEKCGTEYEVGTKFCSGCGTQLNLNSESVDIASPPMQSQSNTVVAQNSSSVERQYISSAPPDAIVLKSSAPIPSKIGWSKWGYIAGLLLIAAYGIGIVILVAVYMISHIQMSFHKDKMRKMSFKFVDNVTNDDIYNKLQPLLTSKYGDKMEFEQEGDTLSVLYNDIYYDINLQNNSTFSIWWRKSIAGALLSFNEWKEYKKIRTGTAIVAYELQKTFNLLKP